MDGFNKSGHPESALAEKRRSQILAAAEALFSKNGFHDTGMEDLARLAGVSKGTTYNNFTSRKDVFLSTIEWGHRAGWRYAFPRATLQGAVYS